MTYTTLKRLVYALGLFATAGAVVGRLLQYGVIDAASGWWVGPGASITIMSPLVTCAAFIALRGLHGGREIVPIPGTRGQDLALCIRAIASSTPSNEIGALVPAGWPGSSVAFAFDSSALVLCVVTRIIQLNVGARMGVRLPA